ncbi:hypothetical protein [Natronorubrum sulfidifaciens]|uniref:Uncharacterized protein n=1 Tax=Natronorubrum sulfidifaciens JCM 14089 TaxID=1230460 RepID=L9WCW6_9EURY|nr:hypothetical protein [Natronorubrum sulfidifaciens]ELY47309.1 hypothetical protein C495_03587 [Natronorubrum sulfidifaciens JCM 14089]
MSKIIDARLKVVNLIFERSGESVSVYRERDLGFEDPYGKEEETMFHVGDELAVMYFPGQSPGGARPDRYEERYGERVYWEPHIFFRRDAIVEEKDIIEWGLPMYPENPNADKQLWELETIVPYRTHIEGQLQRFIEQ